MELFEEKTRGPKSQKGRSKKMRSIKRWKVMPAFFKPNGMQMNSNSWNAIITAV
jgi:hypothetical protein